MNEEDKIVLKAFLKVNLDRASELTLDEATVIQNHQRQILSDVMENLIQLTSKESVIEVVNEVDLTKKQRMALIKAIRGTKYIN